MRSGTETINQLFKWWGILKQCFRSLDIGKHGKAFRVVAIHTQLAIENGEQLFSIEHIDPHLNDLVHFENNGCDDISELEEDTVTNHTSD